MKKKKQKLSDKLNSKHFWMFLVGILIITMLLLIIIPQNQERKSKGRIDYAEMQSQWNITVDSIQMPEKSVDVFSGEVDGNFLVYGAGDEILEPVVELIDSSNRKVKTDKVKSGRYTARFSFDSGKVKKITFQDLKVTKDELDIGLDYPEINDFKDAFAIDPSDLDFTKATVVATASGRSLYKCEDWDFELSDCPSGKWKKVKNLIPGEDYTLTLTPKDPCFAELDYLIDLVDEKKYLIQNFQITRKNDDGTLDIEIVNLGQLIKSLIVHNQKNQSQAIELGIGEATYSDEWLKVYSIDPTNLEFDSATVSVVAHPKAKELFKCKEWDFEAQECVGEWTKLMDIDSGKEYSFTLTPDDPGFAEGIGYCLSEDDDAQGSWPLTNYCDGTYPADCGPEPNGDLLRCDDGNSETHAFGKGAKWGGVLIQQVNTSVTNCDQITNVELCYEWWTDYNTGMTCDVSVDADGDRSWSAVTTSCPGMTANPGVTCTDVTSLETWSCGNFFGGVGNRAEAKSEVISNSNGKLATWDVLYFDVTYTLVDNDPPIVNLEYPLNDSILNLSNDIIFKYNVTDAGNEIENCSLIIDGVIESTDTTITESQSQNITYLDLANGYHTWTINCTDDSSSNNVGTGGIFNFTLNYLPPAPVSNSPPDQSVDIGEESIISWTIDHNSSPGDYYVKRNGALYQGPLPWFNESAIIVRPNNYFTGTWNYTIYFNDSDGNNGTPDTVLVTVSDENFPDCSELENGGPKLVNITIDGAMDDWDPVITSPSNYVSDAANGAGDLDYVSTADRDLVGFAYTWDDEYLYLYFARVNSGSNQVPLLVYIDYDNDMYMNSTDDVLRVVWTGSNQLYDTYLHNYLPIGSGDYMYGDGIDMPGGVDAGIHLESGLGGTNPGIKLETRVRWTDLGISEPGPLTLRAASARGAGTNLPSSLEDNLNGTSTIYSSLLFRPDYNKAAVNGSSVYFAHDLMNCGFLDDIIDFTSQSNQGWNIAVYNTNGSLLTDTDSDSKPDIRLGVENYKTIIVKVDVPGDVTIGTSETATITASSSVDTSVIKNVKDKIITGEIAVSPSERIISGTAGMGAVLNYTVYNYQSVSDVIEINASSSEGWIVNLYYRNGTPIADTDSDGHPDVGTLLPGESIDIELRIGIPGSVVDGTNETTTIRINSSLDPSLTTTALAKTGVRKRLVLRLNYARSAGIGDYTYYELRISNNWNASDIINLNFTSLEGWETELLDSDQVGILTDTNSDTLVDIGSLGPYGGEYTIYAKILVPAESLEGDLEVTVMGASSSLEPTVNDAVSLNTTARTVITYEDFSRNSEQTTFEILEPIYVRAYNLVGVTQVYFVFIDANNTIVKTSNMTDVDIGENDADGVYTTFYFDWIGNWTVVAFNEQKDLEIGRALFYVVDTTPPSVFDLEPVGGSEYNISDIVYLAANATDNSFVDRVYAEIILPNGTSQLIELINSSGTERYNSSFIVPALPGRYNITFIANDTNPNINETQGNVNSTETTYFIVSDPFPPIVNLEYPLNNSLVNDTNDIIFYYNATDEHSAVKNCSLIIDGVIESTDEIVTENQSQNFTYYDLSNGQHYWTVNCTDLAGNSATGGLFNLTIEVDPYPPIVTLNFPEDGYNSTQSEVNFNWTVIDDIDLNLTCDLSIDGIVNQSDIVSLNNSATNFSVSDISDGTHDWNITCWDDYYNINISETRTFEIDSNFPLVNLERPVNNTQKLWNNDVVFYYNVTDVTSDIVNCDLIVDGIIQETDPIITEGVSQNFTYNTMPNGNYNWTVNCSDEFGNSDTGGLFYLNISLDFIDPVINYVNSDPSLVDPGSLTNITANVTDNIGVDSVWVDISGINYSMNYTGTGDLWYYEFDNTSELPGGIVYFMVYANDTRNNYATPKQGNFTINSIISISLSSAPINFTYVEPNKIVNATVPHGYPLYVINTGNVDVNVSMKGTDLFGSINATFIINVTKVHWDLDESFVTDNILNKNDVFLTGDLEANQNETVYFRLYAPNAIISQTYTGNVTFTAEQS